jgi:hypothetical protein
MRARGHATVWGPPLGVGRAGSGAGWYQPLREWWAAHKAARRQARLAALDARWDAQQEIVRPLHAEAAPETAAVQSTLTVAAMLYGLSQ